MDIPAGLIDTSALLRTGARTDGINRAFKNGSLVRIRRGFYVDAERWLNAWPSERFVWTLVAAARAIPGAVMCRESAALLAGLPVLKTPSHVSLLTGQPSRSGSRKPTLVVMGGSRAALAVRTKGGFPLRYCSGPCSEVVKHGEFQHTTMLQTVLDVMFSARLSRSLVVADGAARVLWKQGRLQAGRSLGDIEAIAEAVSAHPSAAARQRAGQVLTLASPLPESVGESYSRAAFQYLGFPQPELQPEFFDADGFIGRSDFWWPGQGQGRGVVGEFDGKGKYVDAELRNGSTAEEVLYREKLREDRIRALGYRPVRWGWDDVDDPERLRRKLLDAGVTPARRPGAV